MSGRLAGKVAVVTGGARGMGAAFARRFVAEGAQVAVTDILEDEGKQLADELGDAAIFVAHDVAREDSWEQAVGEVTAAFGGIDVLVNNAGIFLFAPLVGTATEDYMRIVEVNQLGTFLGMKTVAPAMIARGGGSIINISSVDGLRGVAMSGAYVASKFAVTGMTKVAAMELAGAKIRVNSVHPGGVKTPILDFLGPVLDMMTKAIPAGRLAEPDEIAPLVVYLASDESVYCTGAEFVIDGGFTTGLGADMLAGS